MVSRHCVKRYLDCLINIEGNFAYQVVEPPSIEDRFDFAEDCLDRVELRAVAHVINWHYVELGENRLHITCFVNTQLIHKECKRTLPVLFPQLLQELNELFGFESFWIDRVRAYALFFSY